MEKNRKAYDDLAHAWTDVNPGWHAAAKEQYHNRIFAALLVTAEAVYRRNEELERYSQAILKSVRGEEEEQK